MTPDTRPRTDGGGTSTDPDPAGGGRLIPEGRVWKFVFEMSHAPHYVIQHANGTFSGIYAPVEHVERDTAVPFGLKESTVREKKAQDHVTVIEHPRAQSPWADGVYLTTDP